MDSNTRQIGGGLTELPSDDRDISVGAMYRLLPYPNQSFIVAPPLKIKDQGDSDLCAAYTVTEVSEDQEGIELSPEFQFAMMKELEGDYTTWGANLRMAMKSAVKVGSITQANNPHKLAEKGRDFVANWKNYPPVHAMTAETHRKDYYMSAEGGKDPFDSIVRALWTFRNERRTVATGMLWRNEWTDAPQGIIPESYGAGAFGHAFKFFGQKFFGDKPYLMAQLSNGTEIGDGGIFYFPRSVVNNECTFGNFMFKDLPETITKEQAQEKSYYYRRGVRGRVLFFIKDYFNQILA